MFCYSCERASERVINFRHYDRSVYDIISVLSPDYINGVQNGYGYLVAGCVILISVCIQFAVPCASPPSSSDDLSTPPTITTTTTHQVDNNGPPTTWTRSVPSSPHPHPDDTAISVSGSWINYPPPPPPPFTTLYDRSITNGSVNSETKTIR